MNTEQEEFKQEIYGLCNVGGINMVNLTPLYLRDLSEDVQRNIKANLSNLFKIALEQDKDIQVGYFLPINKYEVV